ncbi:plant expansin-like protein [Sclerotinia borealis F-4128]|uniref:Plant expansin-like protein n=1 Tax=Sclerotinia borealis (strain F-4128) TaxID=1432307 RepID=W9C970_SCLBF|nr:plant expansin-like protein [Sclerotinia borealis F-4128]
MKYTTAILSGLMAATVVAQPHVRHQHAARHEKRDIAWVTELEMVTETVEYTTTVWVSSGQLAAPSTSAPDVTSTTLATKPKSSAAASTSIPKSTAAVSSSSTDGAVLDQKPSSSSSSYVAPPSSTSVSVAVPSTTHTSAVIVPTTSSTSAVVIPTTSSTSVAVVVPTTSSTSVAVVAPTSTIIPIPVVVPTTSSLAAVVVASSIVAAVVPASTAAPSSSSATTCGVGSPCTGDLTFYQAGLGACGITTDGSTFAGVALPVGLMGSLSNSNPYCGKTITITCTSTGKTTQATVIDKCMGCLGNSIDLTNFAFDQLADEAVGRTQATWHFNE